MGEVLAIGSLSIQLIPLLFSGCKSFRLICSRSKRRQMREDYFELEDLYASIEDSVQNLERTVRKRFARRTRQARKALKWLSVLSQRPFPGQSGRSRWKLRMRQAIIYLFGQETLSRALEQMDHVSDALRSHEDINRILRALGSFEARFRHWVERFRRMEHLARQRSQFPTAVTINNNIHQSGSRNTETMYSQNMANDQSGFDVLPDRSAAQREGGHTDRLSDTVNSGWGRTQGVGHERTETGHNTAMGSGQEYVPVSLGEDLNAPGEPNRILDGNQDALAGREDLSGDTNVRSTYEERNGGGSNSGEQAEPASVDDGDDGVLISTSTTANGTPNMDTTTMPGVEMDTVFIAATDGGNLSSTSHVDNENGVELTSEPHSDGGDEAQSNTGSHETTSQPGSPACTHPDVSTYSWTWSLVIYASSGVRITCNACGEQRTRAQFSSLLEDHEEGGAKVNWKHISNLRWWPGGAWSWR